MKIRIGLALLAVALVPAQEVSAAEIFRKVGTAGARFHFGARRNGETDREAGDRWSTPHGYAA